MMAGGGVADCEKGPASNNSGAGGGCWRRMTTGCCGSSSANSNTQPPEGVSSTSTSNSHGMRYTILDTPPLLQSIGLGFQTYLTMLGSTVLIPFICVPAMGGSPTDLANVICTIFFASGIITLLQTFIGDRLPIVQGGSFAYISPVLAIAGQIKATHTFASDHERFLFTMQEVQGGIIGSGLIVFFIGATGIIQPILRTISPITVAANIGVLGLALYNVGFPGVAACPQLGIMQMVFVIIFSQYMKGVAIRLPGMKSRLRVFELFPVLLGILLSWFIAWLLTIGGAYDSSPSDVQAACRTDQSTVLMNAPWFRFPYPGQWGPIQMSWASTLTMLAGALPAMVESLGDYFAAADTAGAPVPPPGVISRAVALQGATCALAGVWGTTSGTTAYNENIGAMQITRVGSRRVVQLGAVCAIIMGLIGKFGGLFASLPNAMVSGLFCVMFGCICAVGLAQMQYTDQRSNRNIFILGFSLYMGLSIPYYFETFTTKNGRGPIQTSSAVVNNICNSIFHTAAAVALLLTLLLDNTIPASAEERGLIHMLSLVKGPDGDKVLEDWWEDDHMNAVYGLPFNGTRLFQRHVAKPCKAWTLTHIINPISRVLDPVCTAMSRACSAVLCCGCCGARASHHSDAIDTLGLPPLLQTTTTAPPSAASSVTAAAAEAMVGGHPELLDYAATGGATTGWGAGGATGVSSPHTKAPFGAAAAAAAAGGGAGGGADVSTSTADVSASRSAGVGGGGGVGGVGGGGGDSGSHAAIEIDVVRLAQAEEASRHAASRHQA